MMPPEAAPRSPCPADSFTGSSPLPRVRLELATLILFTGVRGIVQRVEKPLSAPSEPPSRTQKPRHCSVLALMSKCLDAVLDYRLVLLRLFQQAAAILEVALTLHTLLRRIGAFGVLHLS